MIQIRQNLEFPDRDVGGEGRSIYGFLLVLAVENIG